MKHKPTLSPLKCDHCGLIWYGIVCDGNTHRIIPHGGTLCVSCWSALDSYLYKHKDYQEVCDHIDDRSAWKKNYPQFFDAAKSWIEDMSKAPKPRKRTYDATVPKFVRLAIEQGKMAPNDSENVYTVATDGNALISVDITLDHSVLRKVRY